MNQYETDKAFEEKYNLRIADKCCLNCRHGDGEYDGAATCSHREREFYDEEVGYMRKGSYNCACYNVCDAWEKR